MYQRICTRPSALRSCHSRRHYSGLGVAPDDSSKDLFAHFKDIQSGGVKTLAESQRLAFEVDQKGNKAHRGSGRS